MSGADQLATVAGLTPQWTLLTGERYGRPPWSRCRSRRGRIRTYHLYADRQAAVDALGPIVASWPEPRIRTTVTHDPAWKGVAHLAGL